MKRFLLIALGLMAVIGLEVQAGQRMVTDTVDGKKRVIELQDTVVDGERVTDTLSITTYEGTDNNTLTGKDSYTKQSNKNNSWRKVMSSSDIKDVVIAVVAIIFVSVVPVLLIFIIFNFRSKNRKAKYRLAEQILASGQQLPPDFFQSMEPRDLRSRGIKNIFLGLGLFIFLWAITGEFGLGCIGLLVMFTGFGQVITYYTRPESRHDIRIGRDERTGRRQIKIGNIEISDRKERTSSADETLKNDSGNEPAQ